MTTSSGNDQPKSDSLDPKRGSHATEPVHAYDDDDAFSGDPDERVDTGLGETAAIEALSQSLVPGHNVMERSAITAALNASGFDGGYEHLSNGEEQRVRMLVRHRRSVLFRRHLIGSPAMLAQLENLDTMAPNFVAVTRLVRRAALVSQLAGTPIRIQPLCLVGSPGIGKSRYARLLAQAFGTSCDIVNGSTLPDVGSLTGYPPVWRGSGPGRLAKFLLSARTSGPLILVDECEKIVDYEAMAHPLDRLLPILEHDTARTYQDENLQVPMAAHHATLLFACNSLEALSAPFRDRVALIRIPDLDAAQRDAVLETMLADVAEHLGVPMTLASREALAPLRSLAATLPPGIRDRHRDRRRPPATFPDGRRSHRGRRAAQRVRSALDVRVLPREWGGARLKALAPAACTDDAIPRRSPTMPPLLCQPWAQPDHLQRASNRS